VGRRRPWPSPDFLRNPKSDGPHFGFREKWRRAGILGNDKRHWKIKTLFKALKSQGFDFKATYLTELDHIEKLLALLAIAFCWAHFLGEWLHEQKPIPIKSHHRPAISIFRYGLD